jgi:hypothetical protein
MLTKEGIPLFSRRRNRVAVVLKNGMGFELR